MSDNSSNIIHLMDVEDTSDAYAKRHLGTRSKNPLNDFYCKTSKNPK